MSRPARPQRSLESITLVLAGILLLPLLGSACAWFSRPPKARPAPDPATVRRAELATELARRPDPTRRCLLHTHVAVLDFLDGGRPANLGRALGRHCPAGNAAVFEAMDAHLAGDPWAAGEAALRYLEATAGDPDPARVLLRRIAAVLAGEAELPDVSFLRRLAAVALRDPALPVLLWANRPHLLRTLADPSAGRALGTGLRFARSAPVPLLGRLHFERARPAGQGGSWTDGDPLRSTSGHPEAIDLALTVTCTRPTPLLLELRPQGPASVHLEDRPVASTARTPGVEEGLWRVSLSGFTGTKRLMVRLVAPARTIEPRIRLVPSTACTFGTSRPGEPSPGAVTPEPGATAVPAWLAPLEALADSQLATASGVFATPRAALERLLGRSPKLEYTRAVLAGALLADPSLLPETARRLIGQLADAHADAGWSRIVAARFLADEGHPERALERLYPLRSAWAIVARARLARAAGGSGTVSPSPAELAPSSRHHLLFVEAALDANRQDPRAALAHLRPALALRPDLPDLFHHHLRLQQFAEALAEGRRLVALGAADADLYARLGAACLGLQNPACAMEWNDRRLALDPGSEAAFLRRLDLITAAGQDRDAFLELAAHVRRFPGHREALLLYWSHPSFTPPNLPDLKALLDLRWGEEAPAVFLLNREEHFVSAHGGAFVRVTRWVRLNSPVAVEELGELELPADAILLDVHTRKADGTEYPPSATPQKASFSLRNLEPGDIVAFSYLRANPPIPGLPGRTWGHRFQFQHRVFPTVLAEWILHAPAGIPLVQRPEGQVPALSRTEDSDGVHLRLQAWTRDRVLAEPRSAGFLPPSIQVHAGFTEADLHALIDEEAPWPDWDSLELAALARRLCPAPSPACVADTARWVLRNIREDRRLTRAAHVLQRRTGSRLHLLASLLSHQGRAPRMLLARATRGSNGPIAWPDPSDYPIWLLEVPGFGVIDPRFTHLPPGRMVPAVGGTLALGLGPGPPTVRLAEAAPQTRRLEILATLLADRSARFEVRDRSAGFHAAQKLEQFAGLTPEALRERIQVDSLQRHFPGSRLLSLDWKKPSPDLDGLSLSYTFEAPSVCAPAGDNNLEMRRLPFPWSLRRRFSVFLPRTTDFWPGALPDTRLELTVVPPRGLRVEPAPELRIETGFGRLTRTLVTGAGGTGRLIIEKSLRPGVVTVARWKEFTSFVTLLDEYEALPVVLVPVDRGER